MKPIHETFLLQMRAPIERASQKIFKMLTLSSTAMILPACRPVLPPTTFHLWLKAALTLEQLEDTSSSLEERTLEHQSKKFISTVGPRYLKGYVLQKTLK